MSSKRSTARQLIDQALSRARTSVAPHTGEGPHRPAREVAIKARARATRELGES